MKEKFLSFILVFVILVTGMFILTGCSNESVNISTVADDFVEEVDNNTLQTNEDLKDPIIEWYQLYNPNGYDTLTAIISNPNNVNIDVSYDLVFYKDGVEVSRIEYCSNCNISPKHNDVIWINSDVPSASEADEVKMENVTTAETSYKSIDAEIEYIETIEDKAYFSVKHSDQPTLDTIWIFKYNDQNNNKKCDSGELIIVDFVSVMETETKISVDTDVVDAIYGIDYNSYEIYYNAY